MITWLIPEFEKEYGEYFENEYTNQYFERLGISFGTPEKLHAVLATGKIIGITKQALLLSEYTNMTLDDADFETELADPEYREAYDSMEVSMKATGHIKLPAPIVFHIDGLFYGFAGNRRMNLAFRNNLPLYVWLVTVSSVQCKAKP